MFTRTSEARQLSFSLVSRHRVGVVGARQEVEAAPGSRDGNRHRGRARGGGRCGQAGDGAAACQADVAAVAKGVARQIVPRRRGRRRDAALIPHGLRHPERAPRQRRGRRVADRRHHEIGPAHLHPSLRRQAVVGLVALRDPRRVVRAGDQVVHPGRDRRYRHRDSVFRCRARPQRGGGSGAGQRPIATALRLIEREIVPRARRPRRQVPLIYHPVAREERATHERHLGRTVHLHLNQIGCAHVDLACRGPATHWSMGRVPRPS
jgi:hypothetical protein